MKKIILLLLLAFLAYFMYTRTGVHEKLYDILQPEITISDLKSRPSVFADSLVQLKNLHVKETLSMMNYSKSKVSDESGNEMVLLSGRPFRLNETIVDIKGRFTVLYQDGDKSCEVFIADDFKPLYDLIKDIKQSFSK